METVYDTNFKDFSGGSVDEIAKLADLDWEIIKKPLVFFADGETPVRSVSSTLLMYRNGRFEKELSTSGKDRKPTQPKKLIEAYLSLESALGLTLLSAGHTREGKHIYLLASRGQKENVSSLGFKKCLLFTTSNDGNRKTRIKPVSFNLETGVQLSQNRSLGQKNGEYALSHHFDFNVTEAKVEIEALYGEWDAFFGDMEELSEIFVSDEVVSDFHHRMYDRFNKGNATTKRKYDIVMRELQETLPLTRSKLPIGVHGSLMELVVSFWDYIDFKKHRKGSVVGKIHAINFAADELTKRCAFYTAMEIASEQRVSDA